MQTIGEFLAPIIQAGLDRKKDHEKLTAEDGTRKPDTAHQVMLDQLLEVSNGMVFPSAFRAGTQRRSTDPKLIADEVLNILIAGRDTVCRITCVTVQTKGLVRYLLAVRRPQRSLSSSISCPCILMFCAVSVKRSCPALVPHAAPTPRI